MQELSHNKEDMRPVRRIITRFFLIENLYMKFILTVIAILLLIIAEELNRQLSNIVYILFELCRHT